MERGLGFATPQASEKACWGWLGRLCVSRLRQIFLVLPFVVVHFSNCISAAILEGAIHCSDKQKNFVLVKRDLPLPVCAEMKFRQSCVYSEGCGAFKGMDVRPLAVINSAACATRVHFQLRISFWCLGVVGHVSIRFQYQRRATT